MKCGIKFFALNFLCLSMLTFPVKLEEFCETEELAYRQQAFRILYKDVCRLLKNVLSEMSVDFTDECAHYCLKDVFCVGYSFKAKQNNEPNCQLTHKLDHEFHSCLDEDKNWSFFHGVGPRKMKCSNKKGSKCRNGGTMILDLSDGPGSDPYRCKCPADFTGTFCEITKIKIAPYKECTNYTWLNESYRNEHFFGTVNDCGDSTLLPGWYRFGGEAGNKMPTSCVPANRCGALYPSWINGANPSVNDGIITLLLCFNFGKCCGIRSTIKVLNCGPYYVYSLWPILFCKMRFCATFD